MAGHKLQALVYDILPSTTAVFRYVIGSWKLSANEQFFVGTQTVVCYKQLRLYQTFVFCCLRQLKTKIVWIIDWDGTFFSRGGCVSCLCACLGVGLLPQSYQYPNLSEGADLVGGQLRGDKECPFSGVTKSGRVWRKVPESDARSVSRPQYSSGTTTERTAHSEHRFPALSSKLCPI